MPSKFDMICKKAEKKLDAKEQLNQQDKSPSIAKDLVRVAITTAFILLTISAVYLTYLWAAAKVSS
jgi:hypothetical protein